MERVGVNLISSLFSNQDVNEISPKVSLFLSRCRDESQQTCFHEAFFWPNLKKKKKIPLICKKVCTLAWGDIRLLWISVNAQNIWYKTHLPNKLWRSQQFGNPCFNSYCIFMIYFQFAALSRIFSLFLKILAHPLNRMFDSVCTQSLSKCRSAS